MSTFNNVTEKHTHTIAISATDTWFGFSIARNLLTDCGGYRHHITIRCLTKNPNSKPVERLRCLGGEIHEVDYNDEKSLDAALHNAHYLVFVIEENEKRVKEANCLAKAAEKNDVNNVIVSSMEGAGDGHGQILRDFREVEKTFKETARSVVILRSAFIQQAMFLWSHSIEEKGEIIMTPGEKDEFAPFNLEDLFNAIKDIMIQEGKVREEI
ncbi:12290_t:CDS:2, partial [Acaulospora morrowiae]